MRYKPGQHGSSEKFHNGPIQISTEVNLSGIHSPDSTLFKGFILVDDALPAGEEAASWQRSYRPQAGCLFDSARGYEHDNAGGEW